MPLFFFHVFDNDVTLDPEGRELPDLDAARRMAVREARTLICESIMAGTVNLRHRMEVHDKAGNVVAQVSYGDAVAIQG